MILQAGRLVAAGLLTVIVRAASDPKPQLRGDSEAWFSIFADANPELVATGLRWSEGPVWTSVGLLLSDTVSGTMWHWDEAHHRLARFLSSAGGCPESTDLDGAKSWECDPEQAEPGSNGMAVLNQSHVVLCQHGAHRLALLDLRAKSTKPLVSEYHGRRLNSPNDVVLHPSGAVIFTDPYYGFLEKSRFYDDYYTHLKSQQGFAGIYSLTPDGQLRLLDSSMQRPNGLAVHPSMPSNLVVSECCQGHAPHCRAGLARWKVFHIDAHAQEMQAVQTIEYADEDKPGCSDGMKIHAGTGLLVSSCPLGLCIVDLAQGNISAKLYMGLRVSNIAFGGGYGWLTGEERLWRIPLSPKLQEEL